MGDLLFRGQSDIANKSDSGDDSWIAGQRNMSLEDRNAQNKARYEAAQSAKLEAKKNRGSLTLQTKIG